jgi:hypothetical protein
VAGLLLVAAALSVAAGCEKEKYLRAEPSALEKTAEWDEDTGITIEASASWIADLPENVDWLDFRYDASDRSLLWILPERNESLEKRQTEITIVSGDGLLIVVPVVQDPMEVVFDVRPAVIDPFGARDATTRTLTVETSLSEWEADVLEGEEWITLTKGEGEAAAILTVGAAETRQQEERRGRIVVYPVNENFHAMADTLAVVQAGIDLLVTGEAIDDQTLVVEVAGEGGSVPLTVFSREGWRVTVAGDPEGRVSFDLTEGEGEIEVGIPIVMSVAENTGEEVFEFTLLFESAGETYEYRCRQQIKQPEREEEET